MTRMTTIYSKIIDNNFEISFLQDERKKFIEINDYIESVQANININDLMISLQSRLFRGLY